MIVSLQVIQIPIDEIVPSPYQPRLTFDLEDLKGSILRDGILVPITVRRKNGQYELIDGERRTRLAKELGYKMILANVIDVDDATARRMVWKVNTLRKDYRPEEKARYFKRLQDEGMSLRGIAAECDQTSPHMVLAYLNVFKLPEDYQRMVWDGAIPIRVIQSLEQLFNGVLRITIKNNPEIFVHLDKAYKEKYYSSEQIQEAIKPYLAKLRREQVDAAKNALEKIEPEVNSPETPEELERAAQTLKQEAKRREKAQKTPEQLEAERLEKERKKQEKANKKREQRNQREQQLKEKARQEVTKEIKQELRQEVQQDPELRAKIALEERTKQLTDFKKRYEIEEPATDMGQKYHERMVSLFYQIRGWGIPTILSMGEKWWSRTIPYIQGINDWSSFLLEIRTDKPLEKQPKKPMLKVEIDEHKIVEAEYQIIKEE